MSNQFIWQDRFNIGVEVIDREHKKLFGIMNRLLTFSEKESKRQWVCEESIKYFKDHAMKHFAEEEVYMASIHYPGFETARYISAKNTSGIRKGTDTDWLFPGCRKPFSRRMRRMDDRAYINGGSCNCRKSYKQVGQPAAGRPPKSNEQNNPKAFIRIVPPGRTGDKRPLRR